MMKQENTIIEPKNIIIGQANAPVHLVEFSDYETEATVKAHALVRQILADYNGKVKYSFRHFPLRHIHQKAQKAAEAAVAAAQEGMFWEMHERLLNNRRHLGIISLKTYAKEIGIANKRFLDQLINGTYGWFVQDDLDEGIRLGVKEIPTFFINGEKLEGSVTLENLKARIDAAIHPLKD